MPGLLQARGGEGRAEGTCANQLKRTAGAAPQPAESNGATGRQQAADYASPLMTLESPPAAGSMPPAHLSRSSSCTLCCVCMQAHTLQGEGRVHVCGVKGGPGLLVDGFVVFPCSIQGHQSRLPGIWRQPAQDSQQRSLLRDRHTHEHHRMPAAWQHTAQGRTAGSGPLTSTTGCQRCCR